MRNKLIFTVGTVWTLFFAAGLSQYTGSKLTYIAFSFSFLALLASGFYKQVSYGYIFLSVFLWLGFWLKLTAHLILSYAYTEPTGLFSGAPVEWDVVLRISALAALAIMAARLAWRLAGGRDMTVPCGVECKAPAWYLPHRNLFWAGLLVFVVGVAIVNVVFGIHLIGLYPRTIFPWPTNSLVAWTLNIGAAMAMATLLYWDIGAGQSVFYPVLALIFEAFTSTVAILSRGTFLYHALPLGFSVLKNRASMALFSGRKAVFALVFLVLSFLGSMYLVGVLRNYYYFDIADATPRSARSARSALWGPLSTLVFDRWIGLEGVMTIYSYPEKSTLTLIKAVTEKRSLSERPMYEAIAGSHYRFVDKKNRQFGSIPGAAGFFYYSGRAWVVFLGVFLLGLAVLTAEYLVWRMTSNPFLCSLLGMVAANTAAQFGTAPRQLLPHLVIIALAVVVIRAVEQISLRFSAGGIKL